MPQTDTISIPIEAVDKLTTTAKKVAASLDAISKEERDLEQATKKANAESKKQSMSFTELSSALNLVQQGLRYVKQGYDFAKEGAQIEFQRERFDRLAQSIGTTGDALTQKLLVATKGTLSEMEAMSSASELMGLGLAKNEEQAIRLATVQAGLAQDTNQLVLALSNMTTMRFDQLNMSVDGFNERVKELEASGLSASEAFTEAFIQQGEAQLIRVGNAADSAAGQFMVFEASIKNTMTTLKVGAGEALLPVIENYNKMTEAAEKVDEQYGMLAPAARRYQIELQMQADELERTAEASKIATQAWRDGEKAMDDLSSATADATQTAEDFRSTNESMIGTIMSLQSETDRYTEKNAELTQKMAELRAEQDKYTEGGSKYNEIQLEIDETGKAIGKLADEHEEAGKRIAFSLLQQKLSMDGLSDTEFATLVGMGTQWGIFSQQVADSAMAMSNDAATYAASLLKPKGEQAALLEQIHRMKNLSGSVFDYYVNIHTQGAFPSASVLGQGHEQTGSGPLVGGYAKGGRWGGEFAYIGEEGYEMITPAGYIIPHARAKELERMGISPNVGYARLEGGSTSPGPYVPTTSPSRPSGGGGGGGSSPPPTTSSSSTVVKKTQEAAVVAAQETVKSALPSIQQAVINASAAAQAQAVAQQQAQANLDMLSLLNQGVRELITKTASATDIGRASRDAVQAVV